MISNPSLNAGRAQVVSPGQGRNPADVRNERAADGQQVSAVASSHNRLNMQILKSSMEVSIQAGEKSQELVFRAAIDRINELLGPELGPDAIQGASGQGAIQDAMGQDNSPEATAGRILSLSTGFYEAYASQHTGEDSDQVAKNFVDLIRGGFEQGFNEAKDILKGLGVLNGDIESGIMKTFDLVQKGFDDFLAGKLKPVEAEVSAADSGTVAGVE